MQSEDETVEIEIKHLKFGMSPRREGQDIDHAQALTFVLDQCPPIVVDRHSQTIVDGMHRVSAARMLGRSVVKAVYFDGSNEDAFVEAIRLNIRHGKPLSLSERESAAKNVLKMCPEWSDRRIAEVCGLSDKTVGRIRRSTAEFPQLQSRVGRDGRSRTIDPKATRSAKVDGLQVEPGVGMKPVSGGHSSGKVTRDFQSETSAHGETANARPQVRLGAHEGSPPMHQETGRGKVELWADDLAIQAIPGGQEFASWLAASGISGSQWASQIENLPLSRIPQIITEARSRSDEWAKFADALEIRARKQQR